MRNLRGSYVHRGDAARRRRRVLQILCGLAAVAAAGYWTAGRHPHAADAEPAVGGASSSFFSSGETRKLREELASTKGQLSLVQAQFQRADAIIRFSTRFEVPAGLAGKVFDASLREGIDPELAFRLVNLESQFNPRAVSKVGAVGLMQIMPSTARVLDTSVRRDDLLTPDTNLRLGFRYLHNLLTLFHGNVHLALLAYNRGEDAVSRDVRAGVNPGNGYDRDVLKGYTGTGVIE